VHVIGLQKKRGPLKKLVLQKGGVTEKGCKGEAEVREVKGFAESDKGKLKNLVACYQKVKIHLPWGEPI